MLTTTEMSSTTTAEKKKIAAVEDHISTMLEASAATSTSPWTEEPQTFWVTTGRLAM